MDPTSSYACVEANQLKTTSEKYYNGAAKVLPNSADPNTSSPFQRLADSVRKSFSRIKIRRRKKGGGLPKSGANKKGQESDDSDGRGDASINTIDEIVITKHGRNSKHGVDPECESVDSGLETDHSSDLTPSGKVLHREVNQDKSGGLLRREVGQPGNSDWSQHRASNRSSSYYTESLLSTTTSTSGNIVDRKSSGRSNHTIDSGILVNNKRSPPSRNLRYSTDNEYVLPKKRVSILLPERPVVVQQAKFVKAQPKLYHQHEQQANNTHIQHFLASSTGSIRPDPVETDVIAEAMHELMSVNTQHCDTIFLMFVPRPNLRALSADDIGRVLYGVYSILKCEDMQHLHYFEISVWMLQRFVFKVSRMLETTRHRNNTGVANSHFHRHTVAWETLLRRSEVLKYSRTSRILQDTRSLFLELWCSLLEDGGI
eukprot:TRINITY_DN3745_c0_g1_i5.p1 TRINITY_DN3745_c0_g1~~TRINITY_DN3745_c0_g1_i5.p1  ORF type:complete len:429 (-),score=76.86 TRINITY_DN3745_c0_g1_i5:1028-2314(-)